VRARELVALAVALVVLVVGQLPAYARAGENTCAPRIAVREARDHDEGKLEMARGKGTTGGTEKGRPKAKAMARGRARLKLGPDAEVRRVPATWAEVERELATTSGPEYEAALRRRAVREAAAASGELVVDLPVRVLLTSEGGEPIRLAERYEHPLVRRLAALSCDFLDFAKEHLNDEAAAIGEILSAVACTVEQRDLGATGEPHAWARKHLARMSTGDALVDPTGQEIPLNSGRSLPFAQDAMGRRASTAQLSGGFAIVERLVGVFFGRGQSVENWSPADLDMIADCMRGNLPALKSLRDDEAIVRARIRGALAVLVPKHAGDPRTAELVAEALVSGECELSSVVPSVALDFLRGRVRHD